MLLLITPVVIKIKINPYINKIKLYNKTGDYSYLDNIADFEILSEDKMLISDISNDILNTLDCGALSLLTNDTTKTIYDILVNDDIRPDDVYYLFVKWIYSSTTAYDYDIDFEILQKLRTKREVLDVKWTSICKLLTKNLV